MQMKIKWIFGMLVLAQTMVAQEKILTLDECIGYAIEHNPQRTKQEAQNAIYKLDRLEAIGGFLPSLRADTKVDMDFGRHNDVYTNIPINDNTFSNNYGIYSSMTLFDGFSQIYRAKMAKINRLKGKEDLQGIKDKIAFDVMEIFFNALYYKGTVELAQQQLDESVNNLKKFERMEELGIKSIPDLTEIQAKEAEDRFLLTKQTNLYNLELIKLKEKMHWSVEENLRIADYDKTVLASKESESAFAVYQQALSTLPTVLSADKSLSATEMQYKIARGRLFPTLSLGAGFSTEFSRYMDGSVYKSFSQQLKEREKSYVGLSLSIPIFDGFSRSSEMKRSKQRLVIAKSEHEATLRQVYSEIEQTVADVNGLSDECLYAQKRTTAMQSAHQMNQRKYEEGLIDAIDLSTSANRLLQARIEALHTQLNYQLKYKLLQYYKGIMNYETTFDISQL
jgi:outer membrane protein TolC